MSSKYKCGICDQIYDPAVGDPNPNKARDIPAGTPFEQLPEWWTCPACGATQNQFDKIS